MSGTRARALAALVVWSALCAPAAARAGGLFFPGHGVRALGRGGAVTAGGDDAGAIWYNPAAIAQVEGIDALLDGSIVLLHMDYARVDSGGNPLPAVGQDNPFTPIPTVGLALPVWRDRLYVGLSFSAPYSPTLNYPRPSYAPCADPANPRACIDTVHSDAPQRYTVISHDGTAFLFLELSVAYRLLPGLVLGASLQNLFASFVSLNAISSDNGVLASGPEDPDFDALSQMELLSLFNPSAKLGLTYTPHPMVRIGLSFQLPYWIDSDATIKVQLPVSPLYQSSTVEGERARVALQLPMSLRAGVELRPPWVQGLRLELGFDWANWSSLQAIEVTPLDIYMLDIPSFDRYKVPRQSLVLGFRDTFAVRLGGEYFVPGLPLIARAGYIFERGAATDALASLVAMDDTKHVLTLGLGVVLWGFRLDAVYARSFAADRVVDHRESRSPQINPIKPSGAAYVGGGRYSHATDVFGLGLQRSF